MRVHTYVLIYIYTHIHRVREREKKLDRDCRERVRRGGGLVAVKGVKRVSLRCPVSWIWVQFYCKG